MVTSTEELPRVRWRFKFPTGGFLAGAIGGFGILLFLQQAAIAYPTRNLTIAMVLGGALFAVVVRTIAARVGVARLNSRITEVERQMAKVIGSPDLEPDADGAPAAAWPDTEMVDAAVPSTDAGEHEEQATVDPSWTATHVVPSAGMPAWSEPDATAPPVAQLEAGLELRVLERASGLALVEAYNGWTAWVNARSLRRKHA